MHGMCDPIITLVRRMDACGVRVRVRMRMSVSVNVRVKGERWGSG